MLDALLFFSSFPNFLIFHSVLFENNADLCELRLHRTLDIAIERERGAGATPDSFS